MGGDLLMKDILKYDNCQARLLKSHREVWGAVNTCFCLWQYIKKDVAEYQEQFSSKDVYRESWQMPNGFLCNNEEKASSYSIDGLPYAY